MPPDPLTLPADDDMPHALVRVWCHQRPRFEPIAPHGDRWLLGRETLAEDDRMSRRHCEVRYGEAGWIITDLGSANGTHVNGAGWVPRRPGGPWRVLQIGRSLIVALRVPPGVPLWLIEADGVPVGPGLYDTWEAVRDAALTGQHLLLAGPHGCGFEVLAKHYVRTRGRDEALTVHSIDRPGDDAALPSGVVLLMGTDSPARYATHPKIRAAMRRPDVRLIVGLEHGPSDLKPVLPAQLVDDFRLVMVHRLEARPEEIGWWVTAALGDAAQVAVDVTFPEACLLRRWADGIPALLAGTREAAARAVVRDPARPLLLASDLSAWAGHDMRHLLRGGMAPPSGPRLPAPQLRERASLAWVLKESGGDRERAAKELGITTSVLGKWLRHHGLDEPSD